MQNSSLLKTKPTTQKSSNNLTKARSQAIIHAGLIDIFVNFFLAGLKIIVGFISNSIVIISDATHGLVDAISGVIVIISEKLASHKRYAKNRHQIEHVATIIIAIIIIIAGIHILIESIEKIITPEPVNYTTPTIIVLIASVLAKSFLSLYLKKRGSALTAKTLIASSVEAFNDALISLVVLISVVIFLIWQVDIEAYISILISILIIKFGLEFIFPKVFRHHHLHH